MLPVFKDFDRVDHFTKNWLRTGGSVVEHLKWQGLDMSDRGSEWQHFEVLNLGFIMPMPATQEQARQQIRSNMPWAEDHFQERVGGKPLNPGEQYKNWPHWSATGESVQEDGKFTHTYMERFWPVWAGEAGVSQVRANRGIRYRYGDLDDVVSQLLEDPLTRQAYLPIFFPEDTGAVHGGRVPCTLGYHFMLRNNKLHMWYEIRSCDYLRHFRDDIYMAVRLAQWMLAELRLKQDEEVTGGNCTSNHVHVGNTNPWKYVELGNLTFLAHSFHVFKGDVDAGLLGREA